ncbi:hypothetical protein HY441_02400 [Candidatus Microgenomates bacterium]|nr:hypothetical protein [Candidatus Microgenomates bacterium]
MRIYILKRSPHLKFVQRFMAGWLAMVILAGFTLWLQFGQLADYYLVAEPEAGGTVVEGSLGKITTINPLFPENASSSSAAKLVFSGLVKRNGAGEIVPELAKEWQISEDGTEYTFKLNPNIDWHDGQPFSSGDVVFTIQTIQNPDTRSPLNSSFRDIQVSAPDGETIKFKLPTAFAPFLELMTVGIIPEHILSRAKPAEIRILDFNQRPIGTGPFRFEQILPDQNELHLLANRNYVQGAPLLSRIVIKTFDNYEALAEALKSRLITSVGGFDVYQLDRFQSIPRVSLAKFPIATQAFVFFNTQKAGVDNKQLRRALTQATNLHHIAWLLNGRVEPARSPLLRQQVGYDASILQLPYDQDQARKLLEAEGWIAGSDGMRSKSGQPLQFELVSQNNDIYPQVANELQQEWQAVGVKLNVKLISSDELNQSYLRARNYEMILAPISLGSDPDVYSYWHSSQIQDPGLNLSLYKSAQADAGLEAGRTRLDPKLRAAKYKTFLMAWQGDAPAIALLRHNFFYITRGVTGIDVNFLAEPSDRFHNVHQWYVRTQPTLKRLTE